MKKPEANNNKEIERKFLVVDDSYKKRSSKHYNIIQGYISTVPEHTVRVRIKGDRALITIKGITRGIERSEWEYEIPVLDARQMLTELCGDNVIEKTRYIIECGNLKWEVDEFHGCHKGLIIAEVELPDAQTVISTLPAFIGKEVSDDPQYYNSNLAAKK